MRMPPIEIIQTQIQMKMEDEIMKAVQNVGIQVDKEELLKALKYDREQYEKGYQDGLNADRWIPCHEKLPNSNGVYQITRGIIDVIYPVRIQTCAYFDGQNTWHNDNRVNHGREYLKDVVAWMERPDPYIEKVE